MDNECFELCKEVYKRTAWYGTALLITESGPTMVGPMDKDSSVPLYTSDYLMEKLQHVPTKDPDVQDEPHIVVEHSGVVKPAYKWGAKAYVGEWVEVSSTTPLKALLKLVLELNKKELL